MIVDELCFVGMRVLWSLISVQMMRDDLRGGSRHKERYHEATKRYVQRPSRRDRFRQPP